jgi:beta-lactamase regulating signal transducer with metallopeptidase domain
MSIASLFDIIVYMSFAGSIVAAIILLAKGILKDKLGAFWHYAIWALLLIRLTVPVMPQSPLSIFNLFNGPSHNAGIVWEWDGTLPATTGEAPVQHDVTVPENEAQTGSVSGLLGLIWLGGASAMLLYTLAANGLYLIQIRKKPRCMDVRILGILEDCLGTLRFKKRPELVYDSDKKAPALYGVFRPRILMDPEVLKNLTDTEIQHIFLHELAHIKRMDILVNWIMLLVRAVHWFNPVVWYAGYRMQQDREIACDAHVLACLKPEEHRQYGETIIRLLQSLSATHWAPVAVGMAGNDRSTIRRRIKMIKMFKKPSFRWTALAVAVMLTIGAVACTNSPASASPEDQEALPQEAQIPSGAVPEDGAPENAEPSVPDETAPTEGEREAAGEESGVVQVPVDMEMVENAQKSVDEGHSPWQLSPIAVTQTFVSLQISPEGITGEFPIKDEDLTLVSENDHEAVVAVSGDVTPTKKVYLKRLVRTDETGIWTVVGYEPADQ